MLFRTFQVLIIGAGPIGLRMAIEMRKLGAKVHVIEKRKDMNRNNILKLYQFAMADLKAHGGKTFDSKLGSSAIEHCGKCLFLFSCFFFFLSSLEKLHTYNSLTV